MNTTHSNCNGIWFIAMALPKKNGLDKAAKAQSQIVFVTCFNHLPTGMQI